MKKIMFNDRFGLTKAVLEGRKTQTRRIVPDSAIKKAREYQKEYYNATLETINLATALNQLYFVEKRLKLPYTGEIIAIAQSYKDCGYNDDYIKNTAGWNNKMFVASELMRHRIDIECKRIEQLQNISKEDCLAEGIYDLGNKYFYVDNLEVICNTPKQAYSELIRKLYGSKIWDSNPFVFVNDFKLIY